MLKTFSNKNILIFYIYSFLANLMFAATNWVFFFKEYISLAEIGIADGVAILIGIAMELPTGIVGDLVGKKKSLIIGSFIMGLGALTMGMSTTFWAFLISNSLFFIGFSFTSGSDQAFAYDTMVEKGKEKFFDVVASNGSFLTTIAFIFSAFLGGFLYTIDPAVPMLATSIPLFTITIILFFAKEPAVDTKQFSLSSYFHQFKVGFTNIISEKFSKPLLFVLPLILIVTMGQGIVRQNTGEYFGFGGSETTYILGVGSVITAVLLLFIPKLIKKIGINSVYFLLMLIAFLSYVIPLLTFIPALGFIAIVFRRIVNRTSHATNAIYANKYISSEDRATTLSTLNLIGQIPYVFISIFFAGLFAVENIVYYFIFMSVFILLTLVLQVVNTKVLPED
jgi:MFS family permease